MKNNDQKNIIVDFLNSDSDCGHVALCGEKMSFYLTPIWNIIKPENDILNMGIMKHTPDCFQEVIVSEVKRIIHIELDSEHVARISDKEKIIWETDFLKYLLKCKDNSFDGVVCWHGPEHLTKENGEKSIIESIRVAKKWILISCPWDRLKGWKQQPKGKEHLGHKSVWSENDFTKLGFRVLTIGERGVYPGYLIAWKIK